MVERLRAPKRGTWEVRFDSLGELLEHSSLPLLPDEYDNGDDGDEKWAQTPNLASAMTLARHGWADGRAMMVAGVRDAFRGINVNAMTSGTMLDVAGAVPLAPLAAAGDPCCMLDFVPVERASRPIVKLFVPCGYASSVEPQIAINRGIALLTLIDAIEHSGQRCEVTLSWYGDHCKASDDSRRDFQIKVKEPQDDLDLDKMAFVLAHPSFLRRVIFGTVSRAHNGNKFLGGGMGRSIRHPEPPQGFNYLPGIDRNNQNQYDTVSKAIETLTPMLVERAITSDTSSEEIT